MASSSSINVSLSSIPSPETKANKAAVASVNPDDIALVHRDITKYVTKTRELIKQEQDEELNEEQLFKSKLTAKVSDSLFASTHQLNVNVYA
jgi:hypothetical protein